MADKIELKRIDKNTDVQGINDNSATIEEAITNTLSRDGTTPNHMEADLNLNSNRITNLKDGTNLNDAVTLRQLTEADALNIVGDPISQDIIGETFYPVESGSMEYLSGWRDRGDDSVLSAYNVNNNYPVGDVRRYNVVPNSTADQSALIQEAANIKDAGSNYQDLLFAEGTYVITYVEFGNQNVRFNGGVLKQAANSIVSDWNTSLTVYGVSYRDGASWINFHDFAFDGNTTNQPYIGSTATAFKAAGFYGENDETLGGTKSSYPERILFVGSTVVWDTHGDGIIGNDTSSIQIANYKPFRNTAPAFKDSEWLRGGSDYRMSVGVSNVPAFRAATPADLQSSFSGFVSQPQPGTSVVRIGAGVCTDQGNKIWIRHDRPVDAGGLYTEIDLANQWSPSSAGYALGTETTYDSTYPWFEVFVVSNDDGDISFVIDNATDYHVSEGNVYEGSSVAFNLRQDPSLISQGFTYYRRVAYLRMNSSSQWEVYEQIGNRYIWQEPSLEAISVPMHGATVPYKLTGAPAQARAIVGIQLNGTITGDGGKIFAQVRETFMLNGQVGSYFDAIIRVGTADKQHVAYECERRTDETREIEAEFERDLGTEDWGTYAIRCRGFVDDRIEQ